MLACLGRDACFPSYFFLKKNYKPVNSPQCRITFLLHNKLSHFLHVSSILHGLTPICSIPCARVLFHFADECQWHAADVFCLVRRLLHASRVCHLRIRHTRWLFLPSSIAQRRFATPRGPRGTVFKLTPM